MCTAVAYNHKNFCFGRTLDFEFLYPCEVTFVPRGFFFDFRFCERRDNPHALLGMACVMDGYPLYFDAVNEKGLCMAGLNFVGNAVYREPCMNKENVASFEFIPYILGRCRSVRDAKTVLSDINITNTAFKEEIPLSQLHWIIADKEACVVVESTDKGLMVYDAPRGVLTNNPPYEYQVRNLERYKFLSPHQAKEEAAEKGYSEFSRGTGAAGLPGDYTSQSRFIRAAFLSEYSHAPETKEAAINQLFHILSGVSVPEGCCITEKEEFDKTLYTCAIDAQRGMYYYKSYESQGVFCVDMRKEDLDSDHVVRYPFRTDAPIVALN